MKHAKKSRQFSGTVRELDARKDSTTTDRPIESKGGSLDAAIRKLSKELPDYKVPKPKYNLPRSKR
ncbi:MAG: hypothetical protein KGI25_10095 [Thaumarchaeota archaeon]|nr:hypothetical protein [Nitrososphaerota archaeon]